MASISSSTASSTSVPSSVSSNESLLNDPEEIPPVMPQKRKYGRWSYEVRKAVMKRYVEGGNWQELCETFNIPRNNVYRWAAKPKDANGVPLKSSNHGGRRKERVKLTAQHQLFLMQLLEDENEDFNSCRRMKEEIFKKFNITVSDTTIWRHLHGMCYTKKVKTYVSDTANDPDKLLKRKEYCLKFHQYMAENKSFVYLDETNYNLHMSRSRAWAKKGEKAIKKRVSSKGANLVIFGAISPMLGEILTECHFLKVDRAVHDAWLHRVVDATQEKFQQIGINLEDIVFVLDNAPAHNRLEDREIGEYITSRGAIVLRLGPYSAPLNPIELFWNTMKCDIKEKVGENLYALTNVPEGQTQVFHRGTMMMQWAYEAIEKISQSECFRYEQHCNSKHLSCIQMIPLLY